MSGRFLKLSEDALDESKAGERLILCRKAAEAFCKEISPEPMPEKVEGNLSRMIDFLSSRKLIDSNQAISLQIIRMWANNQSHDNPTNDLALPQSLENLKKLREWYEKTYIEKEDVNHSSFSNIESNHVRFKYYYEAHKNLKDSWFDGKKRYRLLDLSDEALLDEWNQFQLSFLITLEALQAKVLKENNSREKMTLLLSLDNSHLLEIDSLWSEGELSDKIKSLMISNLLSIFEIEGLICQAKLTSLNIKNICNLTDLCLEHVCTSNKLETGKMIFELKAENFEFQKLKNKNDQPDITDSSFLVSDQDDSLQDVITIFTNCREVFSPQEIFITTNLDQCESFAVVLYDWLQNEGFIEQNEWPLIFPCGGTALSEYEKIVKGIYQSKGDTITLKLPKELFKLVIMAREVPKIGKRTKLIIEADSLKENSMYEDILNWALDEVSDKNSSSNSLVSVISKLPKPNVFGSEIEDGIYHLASDRVSAEEYFKTACRVKNYVSVDGDAIFVDLPQNLSKALTLRLVNEIENHLNKISNTHFLKIFVNSQGVSEGLDAEIYEFLNKFDRFLECFSSYPFPRACILNDIKQVDKGIWIFSETLAEAVAEIEKISQPDKELIDPQKGKLVLSKLGLLSKINDLSRFFNRRDFENVDRSINGSFSKDNDLSEIVLFEDAEFETSFFYFCNNGRLYFRKNRNVPWYPNYVYAHKALSLQKDEKIVCCLKIDDFDPKQSIVICTKQGLVKKSKLVDFRQIRVGGIIGSSIDQGDSVVDAIKVKPDDHILILTKIGKGLRFSSDQLRDQGRATRGVRGIRLKGGDEVVSMICVDDTKLLLLIGKNGLGCKVKASAFLPIGGEYGEDISPRKRGGQGVTAMNTEELCGAVQVGAESQILVVTEKGKYSVVPIQNIRETNRGSKGVKILGLGHEDSVRAIFTLT